MIHLYDLASFCWALRKIQFLVNFSHQLIEIILLQIAYQNQMGSRITRALYKEQRKLPIKKQREKDVKILIVCFLGSINAIYFFLFGYLFRPHIRTHDSIALFLIMLLLFLYLQLKQINRATFIASIGLFLTIIITKLIGIDMPLLKAALILTTTTLSAVTSFEVSHEPFLQTFFLWLAYSCFGLGVKLSLAVAKINLQRNSEGVQKQESMIVQIIFCLVGVMSIALISVGKKILKQKNDECQNQTAFGKQFLYGTLNFLLIGFAYAYKSQLQHSFVYQAIGIAVAIIIVIIMYKLNAMEYLWVTIGVMAATAYTVDFATEGEVVISHWIHMGKMLMIDLAILDSVQKWIKWSSNGTHRPILIVFLYFASFYISQFSLIGVKIFEIISPLIVQIAALVIYSILQLLHKFDKVKVENYEEVIV